MRNQQAHGRNWQGAILALVATAASVACGGGIAQNRAVSMLNAADVTVSASSVSFGSVPVGSSQSKTLTLTNSSASGGANVTFTNIAVTGSGFSANVPSLPVVLAPGQTSTLTVVFSPKSTGAANGGLTITVAGAPDPATLPLSGTGMAAAQTAAAVQLTVSPSTLNFGSVAVGGTKDQTGTLTAGSSDVAVASAAWSGQGYSVSGIAFPVTVPANQSISFTVTFAPQAAGSSQGSISFTSNASNSPTKESFSGSGAQSGGTTSAVQHTVSLNWDASSSSVVGYNIYRGTQSGGPYTKLNSSPDGGTTYADTSVQGGTTYYYVATSVDASAVESGYSSQVTAVVPSP